MVSLRPNHPLVGSRFVRTAKLRPTIARQVFQERILKLTKSIAPIDHEMGVLTWRAHS